MRHITRFTRLAVIPVLVMTAASCEKMSLATKTRTDSLQTALSEQTILGNQLQFQKDSLTRVVLDADAFLGRMDSVMKTVRGLPASSRKANEGAIADQMAARRDMMKRVNALVARAKGTASKLAELNQQDSSLRSENAELRAAAEAQVAKAQSDAQMVTDLGATIERQRGQIATLETQIDSLGIRIASLDTANHKAYYVVGTEKELIAKGIIVKEGGANLLLARPGRTLQPARALNLAAFTSIDQRVTHVIPVPDSNKRYRLVSRQDLDVADVALRKGTAFKGNLVITKPEEFWAPSRYLILVEM
jgi:prefoldin subunit 5